MRDKEAATGAPVRVRVRPRAAAWSLIVGAALGGALTLTLAPPRGERFEAREPWVAAVPSSQDWPRPPRAGERVRLEKSVAGAQLVVTSPDAASARALARAFAGIQSPAKGALDDSLAQVRKGWRAALTGEEPQRGAPTAECASLLLARAIWGRTLADRLPLLPPVAPPPNMTAPERVFEGWREVRRAAEERRPAPLAAALHDATLRETAWFADAGAWHGWNAPVRAETWRRWQDERADELESLAERLLSSQPAAEARFAERAAHSRMVALDKDLESPWQAFASPDPSTLRPLVLPNPRLWLPPLALGACAGALLSLLVLFLGAWSRSFGARAELARPGVRAADPTAVGPSLHVVTGATAAAVTRAALELAAQRIALGERVLLVDGSSKIRLHERLGRDSRWGLLECLAADMPMLGLVQYAGHPGLYLLPHGNADRAVGWSRLGRKLDEVEPHFGRIVLALDPAAPGELGDALRGRAMEGWWGRPEGGSAAAAERAVARFGIVFQTLDLSGMPEATLETLAVRVSALRPPGPAPEPAPIPARAAPSVPVVPQPALEPIVLDCDLQVRERLRFLAWMRRLQARNRSSEIEVTS